VRGDIRRHVRRKLCMYLIMQWGSRTALGEVQVSTRKLTSAFRRMHYTVQYIHCTAPQTPHCSTRPVPTYSRYALPTFPSLCPQTLPPYPLQPHPNTQRLAPPTAHPPLHIHPTHHSLRRQHLYPPYHFTATDLQVYARYEEQRGVESEQSEIAKRGGG